MLIGWVSHARTLALTIGTIAFWFEGLTPIMFITISCNGSLENLGYGWDIISWNGCLVSLGYGWGFVEPSWYVELVNISSNAASNNSSNHVNMIGIIVANGFNTIALPLVLLWHLGTTI